MDAIVEKSSLKTTPLHPVFAAEVSGIDLRKLSQADADAIVAAINQYGVLVFRNDTPLTDEEHIAFGAMLGPLQKLKMLTMIGKSKPRLKYQTMIDVGNLDETGNLLEEADRRRAYHNGNLLWHTDASFDDNRAVYSMLSAHAIPPFGADTHFADMRAAYNALPEAKKIAIDGLVAEHSIWYSRKLGGLTDVTEAEKATRPASHHKLVHLHPKSGKPSIYLASHASHIVGWPFEKGRALLDELTGFATQDRFVYSHKWRLGDIVMWDNLATMHRATPFEDTKYKRDMRRVTVLEEEMAD
jgi:alpha-ketoglutarate-dependent 2,4-dichlorophenoxyacetate dioxygenase